jgi:hypothetical protein
VSASPRGSVRHARQRWRAVGEVEVGEMPEDEPSAGEGSVVQGRLPGHQVFVFAFTVQSLLRPNSQDAIPAHRAHENLGQALYEYVQTRSEGIHTLPMCNRR